MAIKTAYKKAEKKKTVAEIICERLVNKIKENNRLPWERTFLPVRPMNYISHKQYRGINRLLLQDCYAWITAKQIYDYNGRTEPRRTFSVIDKDNFSISFFFRIEERELTKKEHEAYLNGQRIKYLCEDENGDLIIKRPMTRYKTVYPVTNVADKDGNPLPDLSEIKALNDGAEVPEADEVVKKYLESSGVKVLHDAAYSPCYNEGLDAVKMTNKELFTTVEEYYRTLFHELTHSTGTKNRLNRSCFEKYYNKQERSREELVAEMGSLLLGTECGFTDEFSVNNSDNYILSWIKWIQSNPQEVIWGMSQAEKAVDFILQRAKEVE